MEKNFMESLEKELEKINSFYTLKTDQLYETILQIKKTIKDGVPIESSLNCPTGRWIRKR